VNPMPLFHTAGCGMGVLGAAQRLAAHVPVLAFDPALVLELFEAERAAVFAGAPTMLIAMLGHPDFERRDLSSLRAAVSGGAPVPAELVRRVEGRLGIRFSIVFGTTECSPLLTQVKLDDSAQDRAGTLGSPLPQTEIQITDIATDGPVPVGQVGELCARGYLVMRGYHDAPEATAAAIDAGGWYHTGDLASLDGRGYLRIEGRIKDMIIRGGENIYPREIEDVLFAHPAVAEAVVIGIPDQTWGEVVAAYAPGPRSAHANPGGTAGVLPGAAGAVQDPPALGIRRCLPHDAIRQDPEIQAAGGLRPAPARMTLRVTARRRHIKDRQPALCRRHDRAPESHFGYARGRTQITQFGCGIEGHADDPTATQIGGSWSPWKSLLVTSGRIQGCPRALRRFAWPTPAGHGDVAVYPAQPALADKVLQERIGPVPLPGEPAPQLGLRREDGCADGRGDQVPERGNGVLAGAAAATRVGLIPAGQLTGMLMSLAGSDVQRS
jgi:hypothetical protein